MKAGDNMQVDMWDGEHVFVSGEQTLDGGADVKIRYRDDRSEDNTEKGTVLTFQT